MRVTMVWGRKRTRMNNRSRRTRRSSKMSPNGSSAARLATILVLVGLAGPIIASTGPERSASSDVMAVQRFLADSYHFDSAITRKRALAWGIKPVRQWPFLNRLQNHRLYSFPTSKGSPFTFDVVSVSDKGEVALFGGPEACSKLLESTARRS